MPLGNGDTPVRIESGDDYIESLRNRNLRVFLFGELVDEPVDHPMIRPSINAVAETYDLAIREPEIATVESSLTGKRVNRFLHVVQSAEDLVAQNMMQRKLGQNTGTCFQRCVGMDAFNSLYSVTYEIDEKHGTAYHDRLKAFLTVMQERNYVVGGAMTDVKGDRSKAPHEQDDPDLYVHITKRNEDGVWLKGRQGTPNGLHQLALDHRDADDAARTERQGLRDRRRVPRRRARHYVHLRTPVVRHPQHGRRLDRRRQREVFWPGSDGCARRRVRAVEPRLHGWRARVRFDARRAVHLLSPAELRLQDGRGRRVDRRGGAGSRGQRGRKSLPHQGQARGDDASQRDDVRGRHRFFPSGTGHEVRRLLERRHAGERMQAPRHEDAV